MELEVNGSSVDLESGNLAGLDLGVLGRVLDGRQDHGGDQTSIVKISGLMEDVSRLFESRTMIWAEIITDFNYRTILLGLEKELGVAMLFAA